jgi:hypothetical protein
MIQTIDNTSKLPKHLRYRIADTRPAEDVEAYEFTNWLQTRWFIVVDAAELIPGECYMVDREYRQGARA